jgi:hypothetical protein
MPHTSRLSRQRGKTVSQRTAEQQEGKRPESHGGFAKKSWWMTCRAFRVGRGPTRRAMSNHTASPSTCVARWSHTGPGRWVSANRQWNIQRRSSACSQWADFGISPGEMPIQSCGQGVSAQHRERYTEIGLLPPCREVRRGAAGAAAAAATGGGHAPQPPAPPPPLSPPPSTAPPPPHPPSPPPPSSSSSR